MKTLRTILPILTVLSSLALNARATVIVDDTWADGNRTNTSLPTESAWYSSVSASLTATSGAMIGAMAATQSRNWWTYFTTNAASPVQLAVGETLKATLIFFPTNVVSSNNSTGIRIGLYDSSTGTRTTADGRSPTRRSSTGRAGAPCRQWPRPF